MPEKEPDSPGRARDSGTSSRESLASWDRDSLSWRTSQLCLLEGSTPYSERWPTSGTTRSGQLFARPTWAPRTDASVSSLWPTPDVPNGGRVSYGMSITGQTPDGKKRQVGTEHAARAWAAWPTPVVNMGRNRTAGRRNPDSTHHDGEAIHDAVLTWATPTTRDHKDSGDLSNSMVRQDGTPRDDTVPRQAFTWAGPTPPPSEALTTPSDSSQPKPRRRGLNPRFGLWLMGLPVAWLDSVPSGTRSSLRARTK